MEIFLLSTGLVAIAEIGDKTQLLAMLLAARYCRPLPIAFGILVATLVNHAMAGTAGMWFGHLLTGPWAHWVIGVSFCAIGIWALFPDSSDDVRFGNYGAFAATLVGFFLAEFGDKTQVATIALAAQYQSVIVVTAGTTLGMMLANVPAVLVGSALAKRMPLRAIRMVAAALFLLLGLAVLLEFGR